MDGTERLLLGRRGGYRQQRLGERDEVRRSQSQEQSLRRQPAWRPNRDPCQPDQHLPPSRYRPATVSHAVADEPIAGAQKRTSQLAPRPAETASGGTPAFETYRSQYIDEPEPGEYRHVKDVRFAEWPVEFLRSPRRTPNTIPDFLSPDAPSNRLEILRGLASRSE